MKFVAGDVVVMTDRSNSAYEKHFGKEATVRDPAYTSSRDPLLRVRWNDSGCTDQICDYRFELVSAVKSKLRQATPEEIWKAIVDVASG